MRRPFGARSRAVPLPAFRSRCRIRFSVTLCPLLLFLTACAPRVSLPPPGPPLTADTLLQRFRTAPPLPPRFRGLARIRLMEHGELRAAFRAVLLLDRPHRLRVQGLGFAGVTGFDLVVRDGTYRLHLPRQGRTFKGRLENLGALALRESTLPPRLDALARAILRAHPVPPRARGFLDTAQGRPRFTVADSSGVTWRAILDASGQPVTVTVPGDGITWFYSDYRFLGSRAYPFRVRLAWEDRSLEIRFEHLDPDPRFQDSDFPFPPSGR